MNFNDLVDTMNSRKQRECKVNNPQKKQSTTISQPQEFSKALPTHHQQEDEDLKTSEESTILTDVIEVK